MKKMFRIEFSKIFGNRLFWLTICIAIIIAILSGLQSINTYNTAQLGDAMTNEMSSGVYTNPDLPMISLFNKWIGQDYVNLFTSMFFLLLPLFATFPFSWSFYSDRNTGYTKNIFIRTQKRKYYISKYFAIFISGFIAAVIPMMFNFMVVSSFIPAIKPDVYYDIYYTMSMDVIGSRLFYEFPWLFVLVRFLLAGTLSGLIATSVISLSFFIKNKFATLIIPFLLLLTVNYLSDPFMENIMAVQISPLKLIHGGSHGATSLLILILWFIFLLLIPIATIFFKGMKEDVF